LSIYEQLRKIINDISCGQQENTNIELLWNSLLSNDKRRFREYFEEEHSIKLYDAMTFKELLVLCSQHNVGGRFK